MKIEVTQADIDKGLCGSAVKCPIALAVKRTSHRRQVAVYDSVTIPLDNFSFKLPQKAQDFIGRFDNKKPVKPFSFMLRGYKRSKT